MVMFSKQRASAYVTACASVVALALMAQDQAAFSAPLSPIPMSVQNSDASDVMSVAVRRGGAAVGPRGGASFAAAARLSDRVAARPYAEPRWSGRAATRRFAARRLSGGGADGSGRARTGGLRAARSRPARRLGFVSAATAVAWAGAAPAPGMCWYYTDASRTQGFWDYCP